MVNDLLTLKMRNANFSKLLLDAHQLQSFCFPQSSINSRMKSAYFAAIYHLQPIRFAFNEFLVVFMLLRTTEQLASNVIAKKWTPKGTFTFRSNLFDFSFFHFILYMRREFKELVVMFFSIFRMQKLLNIKFSGCYVASALMLTTKTDQIVPYTYICMGMCWTMFRQ